MALSPAEKQKRYRERLREELKTAPDATPAAGPTFAAWIAQADGEMAQQLSFIDEALDAVGFAFPDLSQDVDPQWRDEWGVENRGALGKAERMVDAFIDSAKALSEVLNAYKLEQVKAAQSRLSQSKPKSPEAMAWVVQRAIALSKIESRLRKEVRHSFPAIAAKGE